MVVQIRHSVLDHDPHVNEPLQIVIGTVLEGYQTLAKIASQQTFKPNERIQQVSHPIGSSCTPLRLHTSSGNGPAAYALLRRCLWAFLHAYVSECCAGYTLAFLRAGIPVRTLQACLLPGEGA